MFDVHPSEEHLERYSMDKLPQPECAALEEHLLVCSICQQRLVAAETYVAVMKAALQKRSWAEQYIRPPGFLRYFQQVPHRAWAGAFAVVAVLGLVVLYRPAPAPEVQVTLEAVRGFEGPTVSKRAAGRPIHLILDLADRPDTAAYRVEVVSWTGSQEWQGEGRPSGGKLSVRIPKLEEGLHWVRLYSGTALVREYGLKLE